MLINYNGDCMESLYLKISDNKKTVQLIIVLATLSIWLVDGTFSFFGAITIIVMVFVFANEYFISDHYLAEKRYIIILLLLSYLWFIINAQIFSIVLMTGAMLYVFKKLYERKQRLIKQIEKTENVLSEIEKVVKKSKEKEVKSLFEKAVRHYNERKYEDSIRFVDDIKKYIKSIETEKEKKRYEKFLEEQKKKQEEKKREEKLAECKIKINSSRKYIEELKSTKALKILEEAESKIEQNNFDEIEKMVNEANNKAYDEFVEKQKKKGFIEYNKKWGTPEQVKTWKEIDVGLSNNFADLTHFEFETFIAKLFQKMGYHTTVTRKTRDYGIDVIAKKDDDIVAIQVKKNSQGNNVGDIVVQNTLGGMWKYKANKAIIITTSDFTTMAREQAKGAPIELWNKGDLHQIVRKYFVEDNK